MICGGTGAMEAPVDSAAGRKLMLRNGICALALTLVLTGAVPAGDSYQGVWSFLVSLWSADEADRGLGLDPNGVETGDRGLGLDPDGLSDRGTELDPNG